CGDLLAEQVLLSPQLLERGDRRTTFDICQKGSVDECDGFAPRLLRAFDQVGIFAEQNGIDHGSQSSSGAASAGRRGVTSTVRQVEEPGSEQAAYAAVVYNPVKVDVAHVKAAVRTAATHAGWREPLWLETTEEEEGQAQTRQALEQGATLVVAAGGDGTVRAVAEALRGSDASLGILPSGTGNLLARNLDLPLTDLDEACTIAFAGEDRPIDIGIASLTRADGDDSEHAFLVMAGLGIDAAMIANTKSTLKRRFGWLAYVESGFR